MQTATAGTSSAHARNAVGGNVERVVIFLSDGRPNPDQGPNGCPRRARATSWPTQADITAYLGSADTSAYSILIGTSPYYYSIGQGPYLDPNINDPAMMKLLATPDNPSAIPPETYDYNVVDASGLPSVFHQIASQILGSGAHLIQLYPSPVVTSVSPSSGTPAGGTPITISGQYFTGVTSVTIGGAQATSVTVTSDGTITALTPPGAVGQADADRDDTGWHIDDHFGGPVHLQLNDGRNPRHSGHAGWDAGGQLRRAIAVGDGEVFIVGGSEPISRMPDAVPSRRFPSSAGPTSWWVRRPARADPHPRRRLHADTTGGSCVPCPCAPAH